MQENNNTDSPSSKNDKINLKEVLKKYLYHWKLFVLGVIMALTCAFLYLRFATNKYEVATTILILNEDNDGGSTSQISVFEDLGLSTGTKTSLDTEMGILKSKTLIEKVVKQLKLNIIYYTKNGLALKEIYNDEIPFNINLFVNDSVLPKLDTIFSIRAKSATHYVLLNSNDEQINESLFGEIVPCEFGNLVVTPNNVNNVVLGEHIQIKIIPVEDIAIVLRKSIEIAADNLNSNLITITLQDRVKQKAKDILDYLVINYNNDAIEDKSRIAKTADEFINNRIDAISIELSGLDRGVETYKTRNKYSDLGSEANLALTSNAAVANRIVELTSQIKLIDYVTQYMNTNKDDLIPSNLGLMNESVSQNSIQYNNLILERKRLSASANEGNPIIANLNDQIDRLRVSIDRSLYNIRLSLTFSLSEARAEENRLDSEISANPKKEREIRDIQRQQEIIETLYLYLLQKREENSISLAITAPNAKIIDKAYGSNIPVSPRKLVVLMASLLLGILVPASLITIRSLLDDTIHTLEDVEDIVKAPILGDIPTSKSKNELINFAQKNTDVSESFRLLRTNVNHILLNMNNDGNIGKRAKVGSPIEMAKKSNYEKMIFEPSFGKASMDAEDIVSTQIGAKRAPVICVTSTIRKEGKTFVAINLATALALLNKSVLLIEADLRYPKFSDYLKTKQQKGLTHFLADSSLVLADLITHHEKTNLDILQSGSIPQSSSELLANGRFDEVIMHGKQHYDYVVIDTSAVNIATDTLLLGHYANLFIYVIRADFLNQKKLQIPKNMHENRRLPNMTILMNWTNHKKRGH